MASQTRRTGIEGLAVSMARAMTDPDYEPCHGPEFQRRGICTHPDHEAVIEWLDLANDIRIVDGNHDLGAGALAEALTARGWTRRHVTAGAGTPLTAEDCAYECPFTREGHKAHDVDHEFVSATDPAGLDAVVDRCRQHIAGLGADLLTIKAREATSAQRDAAADRAYVHLKGIDTILTDALARLSVADEPGPEERPCPYCAAWHALDHNADNAALPVHREETGR